MRLEIPIFSFTEEADYDFDDGYPAIIRFNGVEVWQGDRFFSAEAAGETACTHLVSKLREMLA